MNTLLDIFTVTWNEEKIIQDFINWSRDRVPACNIIIYDNQSTDHTVEIARAHNCEVIPFDTNHQMDEQTLIDIRNSCWTQSAADFVCVVDADELVSLNRDMLLMTKEANDWDICRCEGYEMFGTEEDTIDDLLFGCHSSWFCKPVLFRKDRFESINFAPGSHTANPIAKGGQFIWKNNYPNLYHTKWRSWTHGIERVHLLAKRRSAHSKGQGWNIHYEFDDSVQLDYYSSGFSKRASINNICKSA